MELNYLMEIPSCCNPEEADFAAFIEATSLIGGSRYGRSVIPRSKKEGTKPSYVCPGCSNHTHGNNMINRGNLTNKQVLFLT
jgi:hypothetical protein